MSNMSENVLNETVNKTAEQTEGYDIETSPAVPGAWYNFILSQKVQNFIIFIIILNAFTLGLETSPYIRENYGSLLHIFDIFALAVYTIELTLKILALRLRFFKSGWNIFDFVIVGIAYVPATGPLTILRAFRILRVLRLISSIPRLRVIIRSLVVSLPSIGWISFLLLIMFYIFSVLATNLYGATFPEWFGTLGESYYTLFQLITLESWSMGIVRPVMEVYPFSWLFFIPFILLTAFVILNVFIAIVVGSMDDIKAEEQTQAAAELMKQSEVTPSEQLIVEIENMREQLVRLEALARKLKK